MMWELSRQMTISLAYFVVLAFLGSWLPQVFSNRVFSDIAQSSRHCNESCGNTSIPYPFYINSRHCGLDGFKLQCSNDTVSVEVNKLYYSVLSFAPDGIIIDPLRSSCSKNLKGFSVKGMKNYAISVSNFVQFSDCNNTTGCLLKCNIPMQSRNEQCMFDRTCCYPLLNGTIWHPGDDDFTKFSRLQCQSFISWVLTPTSTRLDAEYGLKLEWGILGTCHDVQCDPNAECQRAIAVNNSVRCACKDGYQGDGFRQGTGCIKVCQKHGEKAYDKDCRKDHNTTKTIVLAAGLVASATLVAASLIALALHRRRKSSRFRIRRPGDGSQLASLLPMRSEEFKPELFSYKTLEKATKCFAATEKCGHGACGNCSTMGSSTLLLLALCISSVICLSSAIRPDDDLIRQVTDEVDSDPQILDARSALFNAEAHFRRFIRRYGKKYSGPEEHEHRFGVFKSNLLRALEHQKLDPQASHGVTEFSDLTQEEFRRQYLGLRVPPIRDAHDAPILPTNDLPEEFDWREKGAVTEVKNQGSCGSCWAFSTTGALEGANFLKTGKLVSLSEQQLVDCDHECDPSDARSCDSGCNGGLMTSAYQYALKAGGLEKEEDYPYTGKDGTCSFNKNKIVAQVSNFSVVSIDEDQIAANLVKNGPLSVGINAAFMQTYVGGVSCPYICSKRMLDHGVLLVGYGSAGFAPIRMKDKPYWIIKNSWGPNWGENGFYKLCRGHNVCGINNMVSTVAAI